MTRNDIRIIARLILSVISAVETRRQSGPSFNFDRALDRAIEEAAMEIEE